MIDCSVIIPVYCNEGIIEQTCNKVIDVLENSKTIGSYEIIIVDDGSKDKSYDEILSVKKNRGNIIKAIKFTRNFGQVSAIQAGYKIAKGKCIINISADLQDPPELIEKMLHYYCNENYQIVICTRSEREENYFKRQTSRIFYQSMRKLSFPSMPAGGFDYVLIGSTVKDIILSNNEANPFWQGQIIWTGYNVKFIPYKRSKREIGESKWTFSKKIKYLLDGVLAYSYLPMRLMSLSGIIIFLIGIIYSLSIVITYFFGNVPFKGWAPIMIIVLLLSGFQLLMLGIFGEYLWRVLDQVRNRAPYIIEEIIS